MRDVLRVPELFDCRPAINRAFHYCKGVAQVRGEKERLEDQALLYPYHRQLTHGLVNSFGPGIPILWIQVFLPYGIEIERS